MAISSLQAGKTLCEISNWSVSNLASQKIIYFAHMAHLALEESPMVNELFEAWEFGPVLPNLYDRVKMFGKEPIKDVFYWEDVAKFNSSEYEMIKDTYNILSKKDPLKLIGMTHWKKGAWYRTKEKYGLRSIISNDWILEEYDERQEK